MNMRMYNNFVYKLDKELNSYYDDDPVVEKKSK